MVNSTISNTILLYPWHKIGRTQDQHLCSYVIEYISYRQYQQLQLRRQDCFMRTTIAATAAEEHKELILSIASQIMKGTERLNNHYQQRMSALLTSKEF